MDIVKSDFVARRCIFPKTPQYYAITVCGGVSLGFIKQN